MTRDKATKLLIEAARKTVRNSQLVCDEEIELARALEDYDATEPWPLPPDPVETTPPDAWFGDPRRSA